MDQMSDENKELLGIPPGRTDTISIAAKIITHLILSSNVKNIMISGTSIRDGLIAELNKENRINPDKVAYYNVLAKNQRFNGMQTKIKKYSVLYLKKLQIKILRGFLKLVLIFQKFLWTNSQI